jgi:glycosidase
MPGLPFVYYGEELGMQGAKPDERIRTPMGWTRGPRHAGFTTGTPWQPLQADSLEANVAVQEGAPGSLFAQYRRLIHLRSAERALGVGELIGLTSSHDAVAAYARREGDEVIVVIANVGASTAGGVAITAEGGVLPAGRHATRDLLVGSAGPVIGVDARGAWEPLRLGAIPPMTVRLLKVTGNVLR